MNIKSLPPRVVIFNRDYPVRVLKMDVVTVSSKDLIKEYYARPDFKALHEYSLEVDILHGEIGAIFKDGKMVQRIVRAYHD